MAVSLERAAQILPVLLLLLISLSISAAGSILTTPLIKPEATCDALFLSKLSTGVETGKCHQCRVLQLGDH
ncbi:hypothetical protein Pcac1_g5288 [Phytophthora cactorum]|nr:hypothetical protein Pcac1_g5288 [Phytophthora cactorum]